MIFFLKLYHYFLQGLTYFFTDRYQNLQFQNLQKSVFRIYFINGASNKKMVLAKSLSFLDSNILCFMKKIVRSIFQKFIVNTCLKVFIYYKPWKIDLTLLFIKHKILESKNYTFFVKTIFLLEAPLMKYIRKTLFCAFKNCGIDPYITI